MSVTAMLLGLETLGSIVFGLALLGVVTGLVRPGNGSGVLHAFSLPCLEVAWLGAMVTLVAGGVWSHRAWDAVFPVGEPRMTGLVVLFVGLTGHCLARGLTRTPLLRERLAGLGAWLGVLGGPLGYVAADLWSTTSGCGVRLVPANAWFETTSFGVFFYLPLGFVCLMSILVLLAHRQARLGDRLDACEQLLSEREA
ncbi:MAG: hypothetical protein AAF533_11345 [Acidobacteriota bacterium]